MSGPDPEHAPWVDTPTNLLALGAWLFVCGVALAAVALVLLAFANPAGWWVLAGGVVLVILGGGMLALMIQTEALIDDLERDRAAAGTGDDDDDEDWWETEYGHEHDHYR